MAALIFNVSKGRFNEYVSRVASDDPVNSALEVMLLKSGEAIATIQDYDTVADILAGANVEADFTTYSRKVLTQADVSAPTINDGTDLQYATFGSQVWPSAGGTLDNTLAYLIVSYVPDTTNAADSTRIPISVSTFVATTTGTNLTANIPAGGFASSN